jgi:hypothetical protein
MYPSIQMPLVINLFMPNLLGSTSWWKKPNILSGKTSWRALTICLHVLRILENYKSIRIETCIVEMFCKYSKAKHRSASCTLVDSSFLTFVVASQAIECLIWGLVYTRFEWLIHMSSTLCESANASQEFCITRASQRHSSIKKHNLNWWLLAYWLPQWHEPSSASMHTVWISMPLVVPLGYRSKTQWREIMC